MLVVGKYPLENYMHIMLEKVPLSMRYTNHSVHSTSNGSLDAAGFEARHIMAVSGHLSEETIKCYVTINYNFGPQNPK